MIANKIVSPVPILGFAAYSGTGKTTLLTKVIPILKEKNVRLGIIKHAHHDFDIDHPGKDSYKLRKSGADKMLVASSKRWALMVENGTQNEEPDLQSLIKHIEPGSLDLILVEGFKRENFPKIELHRSEYNKDYIYRQDESIIAIATDGPLPTSDDRRPITQLDINKPSDIAAFICDNFLSSSTCL